MKERVETFPIYSNPSLDIVAGQVLEAAYLLRQPFPSTPAQSAPGPALQHGHLLSVPHELDLPDLPQIDDGRPMDPNDLHPFNVIERHQQHPMRGSDRDPVGQGPGPNTALRHLRELLCGLALAG